MYANGPLCTATSGWLTGSSLACLIFGFYRAFMQKYFFELKKSERLDGLTTIKRGLDEVSSSELDRPVPIELSDYTYSYTDTCTSEDEM